MRKTPQKTQKKVVKTDKPLDGIFPLFQEYAKFILNYKIDTLSNYLIQKAKDDNITVLNLFNKYSEEERLYVTQKALVEEILYPISEGGSFEKLKIRLKAWKNNSLSIPREQIHSSDIHSINILRKKCLKDFTVKYDLKGEHQYKLIAEIDAYFDECIRLSLQVYDEIQLENKPRQEEFNNIIDGVKDYAIFKLHPDGTIASWNEGAQTLKGYTKEEIIGKHFSIFYPKEKQEIRFPEYELEQATLKGRFEDEGFRVKKDGSLFWANVIITAIYDKDKKLIGFTKITRNLTERKQNEEILRRSEERYRLLVDAVKDYAIFMINPEGKINSWNEGARRLNGYTEAEILGSHISIFYPKNKQDEKYPDYELAQAKKLGRFEDEGIRVRKNGTTFYANVIITALYDKDKNLIGFSKITRDLTERKRLEESLKNMNSELEINVKERTEELQRTVNELTKINNDLDNFIYTASHDLRAPVSNIEGLFYSLFDELGDQMEKNQNLNTFKHLIAVSIQKFQNTIRELTEIAKIQKDSKEDSEMIDLAEVIEDVKITISELIAKNKAEIVSDLHESPKIRFVKKNLKSIFYNIISNGIKYKSPNREPIIKIHSQKDGQFHIIFFQDNGLGIKAKNKAKMFTMFKRFHDHVEGSGVGLYIVKRIIENAGGKIEVESEEGEGTLFKIYIPLNTSL